MENVIVYVGPGFSPDESKRIMDMLRMRSIMVTTDKSCATVIFEPAQDVDALLKEVIPMEKEFIIPPHVEVVIPNPEPKPKKKTFTHNNITKQYKNTKQNYRQRFLTRTRCK